MTPAVLLSLLLLLWHAHPVDSLCSGYVPYAARNMTNVTCPASFAGCSANDVNSELVYARITSLNRCYCMPGNCQNSYIDIEFVIKVTATANNRYDIIVYLSNDGQTLAPPLAQSCLAWVAMANEGVAEYDTGNCPLWGKFTNFDSDLCGDIDKDFDPVYANITARVSCSSVNNAGQLSIPYILAWHQNSAPGCTLATWSGGTSKCDAGSLSFTGLLAPCEMAVCPPADQCYNYSCVAVNGSAVCVKNAFTNATCDDGLFCSTASKCNASGVCVATSLVNCGISPLPCHLLTCRETNNGSLCIESHLTGTPCSSNYSCLTNGVCQAGNCSEILVTCQMNTTCAGYACVEGSGCQAFYRTGVSCGPTTECQSHSCNEFGLCVDVNQPLGTPCGQAESACQFGYACNEAGSCAIGDIKPNGTLCSECFGCQQASYCNGVNLSCPAPLLLDCPLVNCQVGSCLTNGSCGCSYVPLQCTDNDACTEDFCDNGSGECFHPLVECPPVGTPPNQCRSYFCNSDATAEPCYSVSLSGQNCTSGNQCFFGVCVDTFNDTECQVNPFDPIPPPASPNSCSYYVCDPDSGYQSFCNASSPCQTDDLCYDSYCQYNSSALTCDCVLGPAKSHPPNTVCVSYYCNASLGWVPLYLDGALCGFDNTTLCRTPDTCEQGSCVQHFNDTDTLCDEPSSCRNPAYCDGFGGCPERTGKPDGTSCGPYVSFCHTGRICSAGFCVTNYTAAGTVCGEASVCCEPDTCDGSGNCQFGANLPDGTSCGQHGPCGHQNCSSGQCVLLLINGTLCNSSNESCQASSFCAGDSFICPELIPLDNGTLCQVGSGCVSNAYCDGLNTTCSLPSPISCNDSSVCTSDQCLFNQSSGESFCQFTELPCYGNSCLQASCSPTAGCLQNTTQCVNNNSCATVSCQNASGCELVALPSGDICNDNDACTINDRCDGNFSCVSDPLCLPGQCYSQSCLAGVCTASPANETMLCDPDSVESCGLSPSNCLIHFECTGGLCVPVFEEAFTECRPAANDCDAPEYCTGFSACCPPDVNLDNGALCGTGVHSCGADRCIDGLCTAVPVNNNSICNQSFDRCQTSARCGPSSIDCGPLTPVPNCCNFDSDCNETQYCDYLNQCELTPQGCLQSGCSSVVGCLVSLCNEETLECEISVDGSFCQSADPCLLATCNPEKVCVSGGRVSQSCQSDSNCSRANSTDDYWSCSDDLAEYPSSALCTTLCVNGTCNFTSDFIPAIEGVCGYLPQTGCVYTPIDNCCITADDCPDLPDGNCSFYRCTCQRCIFVESECVSSSSSAPSSSQPTATTRPVEMSNEGDTVNAPASAGIFLSVGAIGLCTVFSLRRRPRKRLVVKEVLEMSDDDEKNKNYVDRICIGGGALTGAFFALSMAFFFRFNTSVDWYLFGAVSFFVVAGLCVAAALLAAKYNRRWIVEPTFSTEAEPRDLSAVFTSCGGFAAGLFLMLALLYGFRINMQVSYSIGLGALFAVLTLFTVLLAFLGSRYYRLKAKQESEGVGMTVF